MKMSGKMQCSSAVVQLVLTTLAFAVIQVAAFREGNQSCKAILAQNPTAPSADYTLTTATETTLYQVYCEMGINGGGYTFLHPADIHEMTNEEVQSMFTDKTSFLLRVRLTNGTQLYGVLTQFPANSTSPLALFLNSNTGYNTPVNSAPEYLGGNYLYFGLTRGPIRIGDTQGLTVNGVPLSFVNCDGHPNSYFALFPNNAEAVPLNVSGSTNAWPLYSSFLAALKQNPSVRVMSDEYFMFFEGNQGGCGMYVQSSIAHQAQYP